MTTELPVSPQPKQRSQSEQRVAKLERRGFQLEAEKLRSEYNNKYMLGEMKMKAGSTKRLLTQLPPQNIGHFLKPTKIISVTAQKWVIYDYYSSKYIRGYRARDSHQLSVFSKLLVFCAVNTIVERYSIDAGRFETIVTEGVLKLHGGGCLLRADDMVSLQDLLYLLLMEDSEVYETILAVNVGAYLQRKRQKQYYSVFDTKDKFMKEHLRNFYELVNSYCQLLKLDNIRYIEADPELRKEKNRGSAADIGIISIECLKIPLFMSILKTTQHEVKIKFINSDGNLTDRRIQVQNRAVANKYIPYSNVCRNWEEDNFMNSHCSVFYDQMAAQCRPVVVVLLGCYGPIDREKDIQQVVQWYIKNHKDGIEKEEEEEEKKVTVQAKRSANKLAALPHKATKKVQRKIEEKLRMDTEEGLTKRYDQAIKIKVQSSKTRSTRINTLAH